MEKSRRSNLPIVGAIILALCPIFHAVSIIFDVSWLSFSNYQTELFDFGVILLIMVAILFRVTGKLRPTIIAPALLLVLYELFFDVIINICNIFICIKNAISRSEWEYLIRRNVFSYILSLIMASLIIALLLYACIFSVAKVKGRVIPVIAIVIGVMLVAVTAITHLIWNIQSIQYFMHVRYSWELLAGTMISRLGSFAFTVGLATLIPSLIYRPKVVDVVEEDELETTLDAEPAEVEDEFERVQKILEKESSVVIDKDEKALRIFNDFLTANGYTVDFDGGDMAIAKLSEGEDINSSMGRFIAKDDGIYSFAQLPSGEFDLRQRLACSDKDVSRVILVSKFILEVIKNDNELVRSAEFKSILALVKAYEIKINRIFSKKIPDMQKQYLLEDYFDLIAIHKILF